LQSKLCSLIDAAKMVNDGDMITFSGSLLHRCPSAFVRELVRQGRQGLDLAKSSPGYDADLLAAGGALKVIHAGMVQFDRPFGMAPNYRAAVEAGRVQVREHA